MVGSIAFPQYLKLVSKLGSGTFGSVYHCFDEHLQEDVAVKVYKKKVNSMREAESLNEVFLLKKLQSEYIVKFKDLFVFEDRAFLVMEYCDCNLTDYMKTFKQKTGRNLPEIKIRQIMKQALSGIQFIHSQGYMHRDIKPENFVYNEKTQEVKLIDFGTVRKASDEKGNLTSYVSTRWYRAPEQVLRSKDYGP
jgi:serine/threonine protein kinase